MKIYCPGCSFDRTSYGPCTKCALTADASGRPAEYLRLLQAALDARSCLVFNSNVGALQRMDRALEPFIAYGFQEMAEQTRKVAKQSLEKLGIARDTKGV